MLKLYGYWRSSAAFRVRIALNLKGLSAEHIPINIAPGKDEQRSSDYLARNGQGRVPAIETEQGIVGQSMAILEWLEERYPDPAILPTDPWERLRVRAFADTIACDIHPLNNLSVLRQLKQRFDADEAAISDWYAGWILEGFQALEASISGEVASSRFLFGDRPGLAEICLVPQVWNARRFKVDLTPFPKLMSAHDKATALPAFESARPENQPDAT